MEEQNKINPFQFKCGDLFVYEIRKKVYVKVEYSHLYTEGKRCKMVFINLDKEDKPGGDTIRIRQTSWRLNKFTPYKK